MTLKKFILPNLFILIALLGLNMTGVDSIIKSENDDITNITKYAQAQRNVIANYFEYPDLNEMYKKSIFYMVSSLEDSTLKIDGTPIDTTFENINITSLRDSYTNFEKAYYYISDNSPNEDMNKLTDAAIRGAYSTLDPHSAYIEAEDSDRIQEEFSGKFQGIGVQFNIIKDSITVVNAITGGPSDLLGIRSGDRIIQIDDSSSVGYTNEMVLKKLRGEKGSKVRVTIKRPKVENYLYYTIERDDIPLYTVDASYMLDNETGYIKINRFAATTHDEFMQSAQELEKEGMTRMVLDLRNNPGGYLSQAVAMAEEFFPSGTSLVATASRHKRFNQEYASSRDGKYKDMSLIVLVDEGAASASEIVAGAIQDHDRALIVGRRTFGKGLVQQQYPLIDNSNVRVTISRYSTPSGRLIQKPFTEGGGEEYAYEILRRENNAMNDAIHFVDEVPDSLKYTTDAGRIVYGGGGIVPDFIVDQDTSASGYVINYAIRNRATFDFVRNYLDTNGDKFRAQWGDDYQKFRTDFSWDNKDVTDFKTMLEGLGMEITNSVSKPEFRKDSLFIPEGHFEEFAWMSEGRMKAELARQVWGTEYFYPIVNDVFDTSLDTAMELWGEVKQLEELAKGISSTKVGNLR